MFSESNINYQFLLLKKKRFVVNVKATWMHTEAFIFSMRALCLKENPHTIPFSRHCYFPTYMMRAVTSIWIAVGFLWRQVHTECTRTLVTSGQDLEQAHLEILHVLAVHVHEETELVWMEETNMDGLNIVTNNRIVKQ